MPASTAAAASFWSDRTEKRLATREVRAYRATSVLGLILLSHFTARALGFRRIWHVGYNGAYLLAALTFGGIFFAWWARIHLGRLWSGSITRKEGHHVVDTGPYAIVRHPIYTGLIGATFATAVSIGTLAAIVGALLMTFGFWIKARLEESFLSEQLEEGAYQSYRRRVPMLLPFGRPSA